MFWNNALRSNIFLFFWLTYKGELNDNFSFFPKKFSLAGSARFLSIVEYFLNIFFTEFVCLWINVIGVFHSLVYLMNVCVIMFGTNFWNLNPPIKSVNHGGIILNQFLFSCLCITVTKLFKLFFFVWLMNEKNLLNTKKRCS